MLERNSATPLWEQLQKILKERIESGVWATGDMIASENELTKEFNISRMTVRSVLTKLVQEGLLYRVPGKGTFVAEPKIHTKPLAYMGIREQLEEMGMQIETKVLENKVIMPSARISKKLNIDSNHAVYYIERLRYAENKPFSIHRTYLVQLVNPLIDDEKLTEEQLCHILEEDYNIISTHTRESLEMVYADEKQARLLEMEESQPLLYLQEERFSGTMMTELTEVFFKGDKIRVTFEYDNTRK